MRVDYNFINIIFKFIFCGVKYTPFCQMTDTKKVSMESTMESTMEGKVDDVKDIKQGELYINQLVDEAKKIIGISNLSAGNILIITQKLIVCAEKLKKISGLEKKTLVLAAMNRIISEQKISDDEKQLLVSLLGTLVSSGIDLLVDVAKKMKKVKCFC